MKKCKDAKKCKEIFRRLSEYLDGELTPEVKKKLEQHLRDCEPCVDFILTFEKTIELCKRYPLECPTEKIKKDMRRFLRRQLHLS